MPKGIEISIAANTRDFQKGTKDVEKSLERVQDSLEDLSRAAQQDGDKMGDNLGDGIKEGAKKAETATEKLEKSFKEMADVAKRESRKAGDDVGDNIKRGTKDAERGLDDFKDESASTAREAAASFDGSAESIGDAFQEVAANALAGFGPIGAAAGIALAIGVGLGFGEIQKRAEELEEFTSNMFDDMIASGNRYASAEFINSQVKDIISDANTMNAIQKESEAIGISQQTLIRARAGDQDALNEVLSTENARHQEALDKMHEQGLAGSVLKQAAQEENSLHERTVAVYGEVGGVIQDNINKQGLYNSTVVTGNARLDETNLKIADAASKWSGIQNRVIKLDVDDSPLVAAINRQQNRTITLNVQGQITKIGQQVW